MKRLSQIIILITAAVLLQGCAKATEFLPFDGPSNVTSQEQTVVLKPLKKNADFRLTYVHSFIHDVTSPDYPLIEDAHVEESPEGCWTGDWFELRKEGNVLVIHFYENETPYERGITISGEEITGRQWNNPMVDIEIRQASMEQ